MTANKKIVERAVVGQSKVTLATRSMNNFIHARRVYFRTLIDGCRREILARRRSGQDADEIIGELRRAERESRQFEQSVKNSSVRRRLREGAETAQAGHIPAGIERRIAGTVPVTGDIAAGQRGQSGDKVTKISGYAAVFNSPTTIGDYFTEKIAPGAFTNAIKESDVRLLLNHDANHLLARTQSGTLRLYEDRRGLLFYGDLLDSDPLSDAVERRIERGDLSGCSFSFTCKKDRWKFASKPGDLDERTIIEISTLFDVGPVTYPAYGDTSVTVLREDRQGDVTDAASRSRMEIAKRRLLELDCRRLDGIIARNS